MLYPRINVVRRMSGSLDIKTFFGLPRLVLSCLVLRYINSRVPLVLFSIMIRRPSSTMIVGPSGSGKTQLTEALLTEGSVFEGNQTGPCHYCYAVWQPRFDRMKRCGI